MKKTTKLLALLASALMAMALVSCGDPTAPAEKGTSDPEGNGATPVVIYENADGLELDWSYTIIEASKIADATDDSVLEVACTKCANDYQCLQICLKDDSHVVAGTLTGASVNDNGDGFTNVTGESFTYKPTAEEWAALMVDGIRIQGHGYKVTKITLK